jgi:hypothetical protein
MLEKGKFLDQLKNIRRKYVPSKSGYPFIILHGVTYRKTTTRICRVVSTPKTHHDLTIFSDTVYTTCGGSVRLVGVRFDVVPTPSNT